MLSSASFSCTEGLTHPEEQSIITLKESRKESLELCIYVPCKLKSLKQRKKKRSLYIDLNIKNMVEPIIHT